MRKTALNTIYEIAKQDSKVLFIGSDLGPDVLAEMKATIPNQFFMEGVSEQHIVGMAAGLALEGYKPFVNTIATFLTRRCFEQVAIDVCQQNLPVRLIANGGGAVYAPLGPTHLAVDDMALMRVLPNMMVVAPCDALEMREVILASMNNRHPMYIRLAKGGDPVISDYSSKPFKLGKLVVMKEVGDGVFVTTGVATQIALEASRLIKNEMGINIGVIHCHTVKPLDVDLALEFIPKAKAVVIAEEHSRIGGLGSAVLELCNDLNPTQSNKIFRLGIPDQFSDKYGSQNDLLNYWGITALKLKDQMLKQLRN
ncbi:hypothetical protein LZG75_03470 [Polynucleobacter sp. IMCC30063]|uniref:transketolase family protein n=1 Tax=Polynucleobacter sp. IMCC30063 TaxID=2907298 RepID=UPI001F26112D|nr:transketolase C-terminal domain-containing protein [Polynucleobacter sp. IMCC30063]MCE7505290.1 hypothetical protein [Polynucleobacter sp. IMCC30063]